MFNHHEEEDDVELLASTSGIDHVHEPALSTTTTDEGNDHHDNSSLLGNDSLTHRRSSLENSIVPPLSATSATTNNQNDHHVHNGNNNTATTTNNNIRNNFLNSLGGQNLTTLFTQLQNNQSPVTNGNADPQPNNANNQIPEGNNIRRRLDFNIRDIFFFSFRVLPLILLPLALLMYWHYIGVLVAVWIIITTISSDIKLKEQVSLKAERKVFILLLNGFILGLSVGLLFLFFSQYEIWNFMGFSTSIIDGKELLDTFFNSLFYVFIIDTIVKYSGMIVKHVIVLFLPSFVKPVVVGRILAIVEVTIQIYRIALPPNIWARYMLASYNNIFAIIVLVVYGIFKLGSLGSLVFDLAITIRNVFSSTCPYGSHVSTSELNEMGEAECSICLQPFNRPVKLECGHVYCEQCITEWASSGTQTTPQCPVCRANITGVPSSSKFEKGGTALFCVM